MQKEHSSLEGQPLHTLEVFCCELLNCNASVCNSNGKIVLTQGYFEPESHLPLRLLAGTSTAGQQSSLHVRLMTERGLSRTPFVTPSISLRYTFDPIIEGNAAHIISFIVVNAEQSRERH